jgi:hypothetical protein
MNRTAKRGLCKETDFSEGHNASIFTLKMEAARSSETLIHGDTTKKTTAGDTEAAGRVGPDNRTSQYEYILRVYDTEKEDWEQTADI